MTPTQGFFNFFQCLISRNVISTLSKRNQLEKYKHRQIHGLISLEVKVLQAIYIYIYRCMTLFILKLQSLQK